MSTDTENQEVVDNAMDVAIPIIDGVISYLPRVKREETDSVRDAVAEIALDACAQLLPNDDWSNDYSSFFALEEQIKNYAGNRVLDSMMGREVTRIISIA